MKTKTPLPATPSTSTNQAGSTTVPPSLQGPTQPSVDLTANGDEASTTVSYGSTVELDWSGDQILYCSKPYPATKPNYGVVFTQSIEGSWVSDALTRSQTFYINCEGYGAIATTSVLVTVISLPLPSLTFTANQDADTVTVPNGSSTLLEWNIENMNNDCTLSLHETDDPSSAHKDLSVSPHGKLYIDTITTSHFFGLACTNASGTATSSVLVQVDAERACQTITSYMYRGLRDGPRKEVSLLQNFLRDQHFFTATTTGIVGKKTIAGIRLFQQKENLPVTGFVGPLTKAKINEKLCPVSSHDFSHV